MDEIEKGAKADQFYYLSTSPVFYETVITQLGAADLARETCGNRKIVIENRLGRTSLRHKTQRAPAHGFQRVPGLSHRPLSGQRIVQNIMVLRFANTIFEPIWNRNYIDYVQSPAGRGSSRRPPWQYYDTAGVMRDMFKITCYNC